MLKIATQADHELVKEWLTETVKDSKQSLILSPKSIDDNIVFLYTGGDLANRVAILLYEEEKPVGLILGERVVVENMNIPVAREAAIYVPPEHRGKGKARILREAFEHWGKEIGCSFYNINLSDDNRFTCAY